MKITIVDPLPGEEDEIIVKCSSLDQTVLNLLTELKLRTDNEKTKPVQKLHGYLDGDIHLLEPSDIFYFEYVDQKVFAYGKTKVYEIKSRLYELEDLLPKEKFIRVSKSCILNLDKIKSLATSFGGRFEASLKNGEKIIISRQYVNSMKAVLGL